MNVRRALAATLAAALAAACGGSSESTPGDPCAGGFDDGNACTVDACHPGTGEITHEDVAVDDGDACTLDSCDPVTGVLHEAIDPEDGDPCTADACDTATGEITHEPAAVDDGDACTADACDPATGEVAHDPVPVDDGVACTVDSCDPAAGILHEPDHLLCPVGEVCDAGAGCASAAVGYFFCILDYPFTVTVDAGTPTPPLQGEVYAEGVTDPAGASNRVVAELGVGAPGTDPAAGGWTWLAAPFDPVGQTTPGSDQYALSIAVADPGSYAYAYRMSIDGGKAFTYCDDDGSTEGEPINVGGLGGLTVLP
jgi:hypothetical protein